jgi:hypothetical protein
MALAGCGSGYAKYTPTHSEARTALETALKTWAAGRPSASIEATPPIRVVDSAWRDGKRLDAFEVLGEEDGGDGTKQFTVRLTLASAPNGKKAATPDRSKKDQEVRYVVHGRDPIWVYSADDFRRVLDMDNNPAPPRPATRRRGRGI